VAAALDITQKQLRNFLQRCDLATISPGRQGTRQRFPVALVRLLALAWELHAIGMSARLAGSIAARLLVEESGTLRLSDDLVLNADLRRLFDRVDHRLADASQRVIIRTRGRPRLRT
jgi:hypothetical protein